MMMIIFKVVGELDPPGEGSYIVPLRLSEFAEAVVPVGNLSFQLSCCPATVICTDLCAWIIMEKNQPQRNLVLNLMSLIHCFPHLH